MGRRAVLVTGASRGIGRAVAEVFAASGDRVALHHRASPEKVSQLVDELPGGGHLAVQADLADPEAIRRMVDDVAAAFDGLHVVVNNAGIYEPHPITETTYEQWQQAWRRTLDINLVGAANVAWCAVQHLPPGGRIINVSSRGAFRGEPGQPGYGASKAGLNGLTQSLAVALGSRGIAVTGIAPGFVDTEMAAAALGSARGDAIRAQSPFGRVAQPAEIAAAVHYLASPEGEWASGSILDLNGASYTR